MPEPTLLETIDTRITESWGVHWNEMEVVRDFLQNFYDANKVADIRIDARGNAVTVSAPAEFDYKELVYFGSDKGMDDAAVGNYGEGFKASVLNAMRDFNCTVEMRTGNRLLRFFFSEKKIGKSTKRALMCSLFAIDALPGSMLRLRNCPARIVEQFKFGMNYFYYDGNPLFGEALGFTWERDIVVYASREARGYVFYKKLLRAELDEPVVVVCNRKYKRVDEKIAHDRDRKAFDDEVKSQLLKYAFRAIGDQKSIVQHLSPYWESGSFILSVVCDSVSWRYKMEFPETYYARDRKIYEHEADLIQEAAKVEREFQSLGYVRCPAYMSSLGMKTPAGVARARREAARQKITTAYSRPMTAAEEEALRILVDCVREFQPGLATKFATARYTVGASDEIIGELKSKRNWQERTVFLNKAVFEFSFGDAMAVLLHEWGHIYGHDGSRSFTDALTEFIAQIIANRRLFDRFEQHWTRQLAAVRAERETLDEAYSIQSRLSFLSDAQKTRLLKDIPEDELFKLLKRNGFD